MNIRIRDFENIMQELGYDYKAETFCNLAIEYFSRDLKGKETHKINNRALDKHERGNYSWYDKSYTFENDVTIYFCIGDYLGNRVVKAYVQCDNIPFKKIIESKLFALMVDYEKLGLETWGDYIKVLQERKFDCHMPIEELVKADYDKWVSVISAIEDLKKSEQEFAKQNGYRMDYLLDFTMHYDVWGTRY